jgi:hypothetical protein
MGRNTMDDDRARKLMRRALVASYASIVLALVSFALALVSVLS